MHFSLIRSREQSFSATWVRFGALASAGVLILLLSPCTVAQQPAPAPPTAPPEDTQQPAGPGTGTAADAAQPAAEKPAEQPAAAADVVSRPAAAAESPGAGGEQSLAPASAAQPAAATAKAPEQSPADSVTEQELRQQFAGKALYLRGGYLDNSLGFDEHGKLVSHSTQGSYTLSAIEIDKVRLTKHKVELEGLRYGLHFLGALPYEDPATALDRVRITPKKKLVKITIDREIVVTPKKVRDPKNAQAAAGSGHLPWSRKDKGEAKPVTAQLPEKSEADQGLAQHLPEASPAAPASAAAASAPATDSAPAPDSAPAAAAKPPAEKSEAEQLAASIAAVPEAERPADAKSVTTTTSPAHAARLLKDALDHVFAEGLDERMMAAMPDFWRLYYKAVSEKTDYRPADPAVMRQNTVDTKARLLSTFEPASNEYAQANAVAGMALYHTVVGADGKPGEIAVGRPIGFGLDENAVDSIRKAKFEPAVKDGKPVPVMLDLVVQFRIYSKRTAVVGGGPTTDKGAEPVLPGPYSVLQK